MANTRYPNQVVVYPDGGPIARASSTDIIAVSKLEAIDNLRIGSSISSAKGIKIFTLTNSTYTPTLQLVDADNSTQLNADFYVKVGTGNVVVDGGLSVGKDLFVAGNLRVLGAVVSATTTNTSVSDSYMNLNVGYDSTTQTNAGFTFVIKGGSNAFNVVAYDQATNKITLSGSTGLTAGVLFQVSGIGGDGTNDNASDARLNGIYEVVSVANNALNASMQDVTINTNPTHKWCNNVVGVTATLISGGTISATSGNATVTVAGVDANTLKIGTVVTAGTGGAIPLNTTIQSVTNATTIVLSAAPTSNLTNSNVVFTTVNGVGKGNTVGLSVLGVSDAGSQFNGVPAGELAYGYVVTDATASTMTSSFASLKQSLQASYNGGQSIQLSSAKGDLVVKPSTAAGGWVETVIGGSQVNLRGPVVFENSAGLAGYSDGASGSSYAAFSIVKMTDTSTWANPALGDMDPGDPRLILGVATGAFIQRLATAGASGSSDLTLASVTDIAVNMYVSGVGVRDGAYITAINGSIVTLSSTLSAAASTTESYYISTSRISGHIKGCTITSGSASVTAATLVGSINNNTNNYAALVGKYISGPGIPPGTTAVSYTLTGPNLTLTLSQNATAAGTTATLFASPSASGGVPAIATVKGTEVPLIITGTIGSVGGAVYVDVTSSTGLPKRGIMTFSWGSQNYRLQRIGYLASTTPVSAGVYMVELDVDLVIDIYNT